MPDNTKSDKGTAESALKEIMQGSYKTDIKKIIIPAKKFTNAFLTAFSKNLQKQGIESDKIMEIFLKLDKMIEDNELTEEQFKKAINQLAKE